MRQKEQALLDAARALEEAPRATWEGKKPAAYDALHKIQAVVITPGLMITFPRSGSIKHQDSWDRGSRMDTELEGINDHTSPRILRYQEVLETEEEPYCVTIRRPSSWNRFSTATEFCSKQEAESRRIKREHRALGEPIKDILQYCAMMNALHQELFRQRDTASRRKRSS